MTSGGGTLERVLVSTTRSGCCFPSFTGRGDTGRGSQQDGGEGPLVPGEPLDGQKDKQVESSSIKSSLNYAERGGIVKLFLGTS